MALTKLNSLSIPPNTVVAADIADGSISIEELDKGKLNVGIYGECKVKKYNV